MQQKRTQQSGDREKKWEQAQRVRAQCTYVLAEKRRTWKRRFATAVDLRETPMVSEE
eukprot:COSAG04_NODE_3816_length_2500_cov_9.281549_3_plen_57_part_00